MNYIPFVVLELGVSAEGNAFQWAFPTDASEKTVVVEALRAVCFKMVSVNTFQKVFI